MKELKAWCDAKRGRKSLLSSRAGIPASLLSQILSGTRPVPVEHCAAIEAGTDGEVMRWDLRPNDWKRIWPELARSKAARAVIAAPAVPQPGAGAQALHGA